ncbi:MAG: hypothetical protein AAF723_10540 [Pseudomonadota bacterium]
MHESEKKKHIKRLIKKLLFDHSIGEDTQDNILEKIETLSPDPEISDYIFHSDEFWNEDDDFDIDGVIDKAFSYQPIILGDQSDATKD